LFRHQPITYRSDFVKRQAWPPLHFTHGGPHIKIHA